jgi:SAM-dependent methyltransferase
MDIILPNNILKGTLSGSKKNSSYIKGKLTKINIKDESLIQVSLFTEKQAFHKNYTNAEINDVIIDLLENDFNNLELFTDEFVYGYRITSKGHVLSNKRKNASSFVEVSHNKEKKYLLEEGMIVPALIDLGVMTKDGKIVKAKYDKYKQINRFLEIINDSIKDEKKLKIIDFGCGKSYLTFILYYYLHEIKKIDCEIIGLDLKEDVIAHCNEISKKYGSDDKLIFYGGSIEAFKEKRDIDMIVTLHACDTATDYALHYAIEMKCKYIFSVPCCQKEINMQLDSSTNHLINKFGILKERYSAIFTDAIRANILQYYGYKTQVMEFVDFENSPKNLLIRAQLTNNSHNEKIKEEIDDIIKRLVVFHTLYNLQFYELFLLLF